MLTVTIEGKGVIANADALVNDTGGTGTGDWGEDGGGGLSLTNDVFLFGSSCIAGSYSNKSGYQFFDIGAGNELDFDIAGSEEGQHIYMWVHCPTIGLLENKANKGLAIRLGTSLNDYREYLIAGSDDANGWNGGWKCFIIDPTKAGSVLDTGNYDCGSIRYIGVWLDAAGLAKGDNIFIDQIAVGFGIRVTGSSITGWKDIVDYCTDYPNRAWGMFQEREGIYYAYGKTYIGDTSQIAPTSFSDLGRVIQYGISEYWDGSSWVTLQDVNNSGIVIEDAADFSTTFSDGIIVGTDNGRSGSNIIGNPIMNISLDLYGGNNANSVTTCYGTTFKNLRGILKAGNDPDHKYLGCSFIGCSQFDPVGAPVIRNSVFAETSDPDAALRWNPTIDIKTSSFIANSKAIHIDIAGTYEFNALRFIGNTYDIENSTDEGDVYIDRTNDSDPSSEKLLNSGSPPGTITINPLSVYLTVTVVDKDNLPIELAQTAIYKTSDGTELMNKDTDVNGIAEVSFQYTDDTSIYVRIRKSSPGATRYFSIRTTGTITSTGYTLTAVMIEDKIAVA